jgi:hypothetical protein
MSKVNKYLQPYLAKSYTEEGLNKGLMALSYLFFHERNNMMEPDVSSWVQVHDETDENLFNRRCDALMFLTSGDPRCAWWHIQPLSFQEKLELITEVLDFALWPMVMDDVDFYSFRNHPQYAPKAWDIFFEDECHFDSREKLIHHICSNKDFHEIGEEFYNIGNSCELGDWFDVDRQLSTFVRDVKGIPHFVEGGAIDSDDITRPLIEGGGGRVIDSSVFNEEYDVGMIFLSPFPGVRVIGECSDRFKEICQDFNNYQRTQWFKDYWEETKEKSLG